MLLLLISLSCRFILLNKIVILAYLSLIAIPCQAVKIQVVTEYLTPYQVKDKSGELSGAATEIVKALFAITGDEYEIEVLPWARAYLRALNTPDTLIYSISRTPHREKLFSWVGAIRTDKIQLWGLRERFSEPVATINELKEYTIALVRKSYAEEFLIESKFTHIYHVVSFEQSIKMLYRGRIDLILGDQVTLTPRIHKLNFNVNKLINLVEVKAISAELSLAFNRNTDNKLVKRYQRAYQQLIKSGKIAKIKRKWNLN